MPDTRELVVEWLRNYRSRYPTGREDLPLIEADSLLALIDPDGKLNERDRFREALESLHRTALKLMKSEDEDERGMGCAMAEVTRIVEDAS